MNPETNAQRRFYAALRKTSGCPPIISAKHSNGAYYVETKDGKVHIEEIDAASVWDAKARCVMAWINEQKR
jgi:hypothetical protein